MHGIVDVEAGKVGGDEFRDRIARDVHFHRMGDDIERTAALEARRRLVAGEMHGHLDPNAAADAKAQEVDMHRPVAHRIKLVVARNGAELLTIDVDFKNRGEEAAGIDEPVGNRIIERNRHRGLAGAVDDGRNAALATNSPGGPLAGLLAALGRELLDVGHDSFLLLTMDGAGDLLAHDHPGASRGVWPGRRSLG